MTLQLRLVAALLITSLVSVQLPRAAAQATTPTAAAPAQDSADATTIVVPAGTQVPLTLVTAIKHKSSAQPGSTIRAAVAFPITVGDQLAIPPGTIVEGVLNPKSKGKKAPNAPSISIHFTKLIYPNGYTLSLDALNTSSVTPAPLPAPFAAPPATQYASLDLPAPHGPSPDLNYAPDPTFDPQVYSPPAPTDPYSHNETTLKIVAFSVGPLVFFGLLFLLIHFVSPHGDYVVQSPGWQFQMTLQNPLTVNTASVSAPAPTTP